MSWNYALIPYGEFSSKMTRMHPLRERQGQRERKSKIPLSVRLCIWSTDRFGSNTSRMCIRTFSIVVSFSNAIFRNFFLFLIPFFSRIWFGSFALVHFSMPAVSAYKKIWIVNNILQLNLLWMFVCKHVFATLYIVPDLESLREHTWVMSIFWWTSPKRYHNWICRFSLSGPSTFTIHIFLDQKFPFT